MRLNVGLFNDSFPPQIDGVANTVVNYASIIRNHFGNAVVFTPKYPNSIDNFPFEVCRYPSIPLYKKMEYRAGNPLSIKTIEKIKNRNFDIIHSHCPFASTALAKVFSKNSKHTVPVIVTYHTKFDIEINARVPGKIPQKIATDFLLSNVNSVDEVWAVSQGAGENLQNIGYKGDFIVMENGVDFEKGKSSAESCSRLNKSLNIPESVPVFLFVGRMQWYKNTKIILDAMKILDGKKIDFRMIFVGDGYDKEEMIDTANSYGISEKTIFTGKISDRETLKCYYSIADIFLFPSTYDTNGLVVREAASCYCPSLLVKGSCAAEGIEDDFTGFLIEENAEDCACKLIGLIKSPDKYKEVGENAANNIYISWYDAVKKAYSRYEKIVTDWPYDLPYNHF